MKSINDKYKDLDDIVEVKELKLIVDVNAHIKLGWKLLATYKTTSQNQNQSIKYCMGKPNTVFEKNQRKIKSGTVDSKTAKKFVYSL